MSDAQVERWQEIQAEVVPRLPALAAAIATLRDAHVEPTGVLLPSHLDEPFEGADATGRPATCLGLPVTWSQDGSWGLVLVVETATP